MARHEKNCLPQCKRRSYATTISYSHFDSAVYNQLVNRSGRASIDQLVEDDIILVDVNHPSMEYLHAKEVEVYSIITLVSNIGGAVGLW